METLRKRRRLEDVAVISRFFRSVHAQMRRFPCKQTSCWSQLLQNWCFQGILTFVEKYGKEKANNQHLLLNSAYVVVFIISSDFLSYSSNNSVLKSHIFLFISKNHIFCSGSQRIKKAFLLFQPQPVNIAHAHQILFEIASSGFLTWCSRFCKFCFVFLAPL